MNEKRYEIIYYFEGRRGEYFTDELEDAKTQALILRDELKYYPVVIYDVLSQEWIDIE